MRRFFIFLFVISVIATAGALYWRAYLPEGPAPAASSEPATRGLSGERAPGAPSDRSPSSGDRTASARQDMAVTISIWSSVISAIAAVVQTLLTARAIRR